MAKSVFNDIFGTNTVYQPIRVEAAKNNSSIILTPHIGGATKESVARTDIFIMEKLLKDMGLIK